jgi:hypothetical protein
VSVIIYRMNAVDWITLGLAGATAAMAWSTQRMAAAANRAINESRTDRELAHKPPLVVSRDLTDYDEGVSEALSIRNLGPGPAIGYYYASRNYDNSSWAMCGDDWIDAGETVTQTAGRSLIDVPVDLFSDPTIGRGWGNPTPRSVLFCSDVLGNRWRFLATPVGECWRPGTPDPPAWATFNKIWHPRLPE